MSANEEEGAAGDLKAGHAPAGNVWNLFLPQASFVKIVRSLKKPAVAACQCQTMSK